MKKNLLLAISLCFSVTVFCQNQENAKEEVKASIFDVKIDVMSRYIWRGCDLGGESPSLQPSFIMNLGDSTHSFTLGSWAAYNFNTANQEVDLYMTYTFKDIFSVNLYDYYFPGFSGYTPAQKKYFNYKQDSTGHLYEGSLSFNGTEKIPVTFLFAMNLYGIDAYKIKDDGSHGKIFMSKYLEVGYKKNIRGIDFNAFVGAALDDPNEENGEKGYYYNRSAGVINIGVKAVKNLKITSTFDLPIQASVIMNPEAEKIYLLFGFSF